MERNRLLLRKKAEVGKTLLRAVNRAYGVDCSLIKVLGLKKGTICWQLMAKNGKKLVLKEKPLYILKNEFDFHLQLHRYVQKKGGPVAPLLPTIYDDLMFSWQGRLFELYEWVDGQNLSAFKVADLRRLGRLIAQFDRATLGFHNPHENDWGFPRFRLFYFPDTSRSGWRHHFSQLSRALQKTRQGNMQEIRQIQSWVEKHLRLKAWRSCPQQFIHGDSTSFNSVKGNNGRCVLVDLADARWGYRLSDIAWAAAVAAGIECLAEEPRKLFSPRMNAYFRYDRVEELLKGFNSETQLTPIENASFHDFLGLNLIRAFLSCFCVGDHISNIVLPKDVDVQIDALIDMLNQL